MKKLTIIPIIIILIIGLFLGLFVVFSYYKKSKELHNNIDYTQEMNKKLAKVNEGLSKKLIPIDLFYNNRTGELYPSFPDDVIPSVCVWTMWGERESDSIVVTRAGDDGWFYNYNNENMYDWIGHLLTNDIEIIKTHKFLPPRAPIYVTCVDSQNKNYFGSIEEYE